MTNYLDETLRNVTVDKLSLVENTVRPVVSLIIVTHEPQLEALNKNIEILKSETSSQYEVLIIENSGNARLGGFASKANLNYIKLKHNYGITAARNIGIHYARGAIVIFLDDDAIPGKNFIDEHVQAHHQFKILALRGKCLPKTQSIYNYYAVHYDLGDDIMQYFIDLEGNSSFKREILIQVSGFNTRLRGGAGHEGLEISRRIIKETRSRDSIIYYPNAAIYHDYSISLRHFIKKQFRHRKYGKYIYTEFPDFDEFFQSYNPVFSKKVENLDFATKGKLMIINRLTSIMLSLLSD